MIKKLVEFIFFGNYFVGILAVALCMEANFQLGIALNSPEFYGLLFLLPVVYYSYAYSGSVAKENTVNPRTIWYSRHRRLIRVTQPVYIVICVILAFRIGLADLHNILHLPLQLWLILLPVPLAALAYYGLLPGAIPGFNLRNTGWVKAFVIGFVWAGFVNILPVFFEPIEKGGLFQSPVLFVWLFIKNWMFCTVNAIMFDIKDYASDSNMHLKTFVVRVGLRRTIYFVLVPLLLIGMFSLITFATLMHFSILTLCCNLIPFVLFLWAAWSLQQRRALLYYLVIIDGALLVKAMCGIIGMFFSHGYLLP
jgi:4-hydroxybenzoate polyprenyltransferase